MILVHIIFSTRRYCKSISDFRDILVRTFTLLFLRCYSYLIKLHWRVKWRCPRSVQSIATDIAHYIVAPQWTSVHEMRASICQYVSRAEKNNKRQDKMTSRGRWKTNDQSVALASWSAINTKSLLIKKILIIK